MAAPRHGVARAKARRKARPWKSKAAAGLPGVGENSECEDRECCLLLLGKISFPQRAAERFYGNFQGAYEGGFKENSKANSKVNPIKPSAAVL